MKNIESLSSPDLVAFVISKGFAPNQIRGMSRSELISFITKRIRPIVKKVTVEVRLTWQELKRLAKEKGINTYKKKRNEIETLLKEQNNGEEKSGEEKSGEERDWPIC